MRLFLSAECIEFFYKKTRILYSVAISFEVVLWYNLLLEFKNILLCFFVLSLTVGCYFFTSREGGTPLRVGTKNYVLLTAVSAPDNSVSLPQAVRNEAIQSQAQT